MAEEDYEEVAHGDKSCFGLFVDSIRRRFRGAAKKAKEAKDLSSISCVIRSGDVDRPDNTVVTTKYTWYNFLPLSVSLQFRRAANLFYLCIVILFTIGFIWPDIFASPYQPFGTLFVLAVVIGVTIGFEASDDIGRLRGDRVTNNKITRLVSSEATIKEVAWGSLKPGDIIRIHKGELFPCDTLIVQTASGPSGMCYIETSGIDGETNLKIRTAPKEFSAKSITGANISGTLHYEEPNAYLQFDGKIVVDEPNLEVGLTMDSLVLRGSQLRNTAWIEGVVIYAGVETKLVMSSGDTPSKFSRLDVILNRMIGYAFLLLLFLTVLFTVLLFSWVPNTNTLWYFQNLDVLDSYLLPGWLAYLFTYVGLFSGLIPINMYFCLEIVNYVQRMFYNEDQHMYDPVTNTRAQCRTSQLVTEIGQVTHIFSDKTGTLTNNEMRLVSLSIGDKLFGFEPDEEPTDGSSRRGLAEVDQVRVCVGGMAQPPKIPVAAMFPRLIHQMPTDSNISLMVMLLAVCHTVVIDFDAKGNVQYNAEGPDEEALVLAAADLGIRLVSTADSIYQVSIDHDKSKKSFQVLGVNKFSSFRKRMSIIVRDIDTGICWIYMKGADNVMFDLCTSLESSGQVQNNLSRLSMAGLRTLVVAQRQLTNEEADSFVNQMKEASRVVGEARKDAMEKVASEIEANMVYVGMTAIEDALQDQVPETIRKIRDAHIMLWVATGDKIQTAVNIAFSAQIIDSEMTQILIDQGTHEELLAVVGRNVSMLSRIAQQVDQSVFQDEEELDRLVGRNLALVISGHALGHLLSHEKGSHDSEKMLLTLANKCSVVLACRVSPQQKALLVRMVIEGSHAKKRKEPVTMAIGDGANDVPMIQEAKVGVGISGHEGLQAVNSSDFSIARFKFLQETLFVHGRWNYQRSACMMKYILYVWLQFEILIFVYSFYSMLSGQQIFYNTYYTTVYAWTANAYITGIAWLQQDLSRESALGHPECYHIGRVNLYMSSLKILKDCFRAVCHAWIILGICFYTQGPSADMELMGAVMYASIFLVCLGRQVEVAMTWSWLQVLFLVLIILVFMATFYLCDAVIGNVNFTFIFKAPFAKQVWEVAFPAAIATVCFDYALWGITKLIRPSPMNALRELDRYPNRHRISKLSFVEFTAEPTDIKVRRESSSTKIRTLLAASTGSNASMKSLREHSGYTGPGSS